MIVTKQKPFETIVENLRSVHARTVFLVGCGQCATSAQTGGEAEVSALAKKLDAEGFEVQGSFVAESTCHAAHVGVEMRRALAGTADSIIVLSCGSGVQAVADAIPKTPVFPGLDSLFIGNTLRRGEYEERCQVCGACGLAATGGICPLTTCPKGLLNGPCGGMWDGKCEILQNRACAHVAIRERLASQGRLAMPMVPAKDYSTKSRGDHLKKHKQGDAS